MLAQSKFQLSIVCGHWPTPLIATKSREGGVRLLIGDPCHNGETRNPTVCCLALARQACFARPLPRPLAPVRIVRASRIHVIWLPLSHRHSRDIQPMSRARAKRLAVVERFVVVSPARPFRHLDPPCNSSRRSAWPHSFDVSLQHNLKLVQREINQRWRSSQEARKDGALHILRGSSE